MSSKTPSASPPASPSNRATASSPRTSPPGSPGSRKSSTSRRDHYTPANPSNLRKISVPSPTPSPSVEFRGPFFSLDGHSAGTGISASASASSGATGQSQGTLRQRSHEGPRDSLPEVDENGADERTGLLSSSPVGADERTAHGRRLRPGMSRHYDSFTEHMHDSDSGSAWAGDAESIRSVLMDVPISEAIDTVLAAAESDSMAAAKRMAARHGLKTSRRVYLSYYFPFLSWIPQYKLSYFKGDLIAAITMASFYIPMALSLASNLGHVPAINGLYSFAFNPLIYGFLGSCPQMVVGPEAAGSLLTGQVVKESIKQDNLIDEDGHKAAEIAGTVTFIAGFVILLGGIFRLGFLDNVLSRPFQRGFISAIGILIFIDQLIPELGLTEKAIEVGGVLHGSCVDKMIFLFEYAGSAHGPTSAVSIGAFVVIMICREVKSHLQPHYPKVAYVPDRFVIVVLSAVFAWYFDWAGQGVAVLGDVQAIGSLFQIHWPFRSKKWQLANDAFSTSFVIALLGFFESSVAAKSLGNGEKYGGVIKMTLSPNREMVALGTANVVGGLFMAVPAFGGYGRSKVNASTGGKTPLSSILLSLITIFCIFFVTPYFYYLPKGVLSAMISVVGYSLLEEIPPDLLFFIKIRGYSELLLMGLIFFSTIFWNIKIGIAVGIGLSLLRVIRHATRPRIQILGRIPGTSDRFDNAERAPSRLEFFEGCLIIKIPEPLTFANTGSLRSRLQRLEEHGTGKAHPGLPPIRGKEHNKNIIFDIHGVTSMDGAGAQVLRDIVEGYVRQGVNVIFCRAPVDRAHHVWRLLLSSGVVELCGGAAAFVPSVLEAIASIDAEGRSILTRRDSEEADGMATSMA